MPLILRAGREAVLAAVITQTTEDPSPCWTVNYSQDGSSSKRLLLEHGLPTGLGHHPHFFFSGKGLSVQRRLKECQKASREWVLQKTWREWSLEEHKINCGARYLKDASAKHHRDVIHTGRQRQLEVGYGPHTLRKVRSDIGLYHGD